MYGKSASKAEDKARQRNIYAKKHLQNDLDVQRDMERVHLTTIRHEKIKLQKELERMRNKGQYMVKRHGISNHTQRLLKLRFTSDQKDNSNANQIENIIEDQENKKRTRLGLPEINGPERRKSTGNDGMTMEQRVILRRRKEAEQMQEALVARVGQLADEFKAKNADTSLRRRSVSPVMRDSLTVKRDGSMTAKSDGYNDEIRRRARARLNNRSSITDVDINEAKNSIARRLLKSDSQQALEGSNPEEETVTRKVSHVLPIEGANKKTPETNALPKNAEDLVFDQEVFAPDGHVRTVHLLPNTEEAFREAKKARYLRMKGSTGPHGQELTVDEIFAADDEEVADKHDNKDDQAEDGDNENEIRD